MAKFFVIFAASMALAAAYPLDDTEGDTVRNTRDTLARGSGIGLELLGSAISSAGAIARRVYGRNDGSWGDVAESAPAATSRDSDDSGDSATSSPSSRPRSSSGGDGSNGLSYTQTYRYSGPNVDGLGLRSGIGGSGNGNGLGVVGLGNGNGAGAGGISYGSVGAGQQASPSFGAPSSCQCAPSPCQCAQSSCQCAPPPCQCAQSSCQCAPPPPPTIQCISSPPQIVEYVIEQPPVIEVVVPEPEPCPTPITMEPMAPKKKKKWFA